MMDEFPGNSLSNRSAEKKPDQEVSVPEEKVSEKPKVEKIVTGKVKPKGVKDKFKDMFLEDGIDFGEHLVHNVIIPMTKDMMLSIVTNMGDAFREGVETALFGKARPRSTSRFGSSSPRVNYTRYSSSTVRRDYRPSYGDRREEPIRRQTRANRSNRVEDIVVSTREEGYQVLEHLQSLIDDADVGFCSVADYYSLVDVEPRSVDWEWGWTSLNDAHVTAIRGGQQFLIIMPPSRPIEP